MESGKNAIVTAMTVRMRTEIVTNEGGLMRGELHSQYLEAPFIFFDLIRMIEKMEEVFNSKGFPQSFLKPRTFNEAGRADRKNKQLKNDAMKDVMDINNIEVPDGSKCTFEIAVRFRQNATWQGQIIWAEKNLKQNFRSVLEMLRLMDEALMEDVKDKKVVEWESRGAEE